VLLGACILFYLVNNTIWLLNDASSPSFDKAAHARFGLQFLRIFQDPVSVSFGRILNVTQYYPPFFHLCSVPFTMVLGFSVEHMAAANFLFLFLAAFSIYGIAARLFDEWVGIGAVVLTLLYPMVYALSRVVLVDFALLAMVTLSLYCILASDGGLNRRWSALLGAVLGCAALTKWTVVVFVAGPGILWLAVCLRRNRPSFRAAAGSLTMVALVAGIVALPWYLNALGVFLKGAEEAFGSYPAQEGDPTRVLDSLRWYWGAARDVLIMKPLLLPTALGLAAFIVRVRAWARWSFLLCWILPAAAFFVLIPNKDPRYVTPLLPAIAIMTAAGIRSVPWKVARALVWAFVLSVGVWQFYAISFGWPETIRHAYTHAPERPNWKVREIVTALAAIPSPQPLRVAVLPDDPDFEANLFQLDVAVRSLPLQIDGFDGRVPVRALVGYDVLISKTGTIAVEWTATSRVTFVEGLKEWIASGNRGPEVALWRTWPLPDGSVAEVYVIR
jgi:4-amino-4-deoxy-L-arabinose transferase-like glycosyltransferase